MFEDAVTRQLRHRLLHRIRRRYAVVTERVTFGPAELDFTRIADPDRVLDEVAAEADLRDRLAGRRAPGDALHLPYWAELWDSARGIGLHLVTLFKSASEETAAGGFAGSSGALPANSPAITSEKLPAVLDLGCGMGMAGTVAAALGATVTFADLEPPALLFAQLNSLRWRTRIHTRMLNWQTDRLGRKFDLIIGADILYERLQWVFLEPFWRAHLANGGNVLLGEPGRQTGEMFTEWIVNQGWRLSRTSLAVSTRPTPIRILTIQPMH